jgi:hypothetical protein
MGITAEVESVLEVYGEVNNRYPQEKTAVNAHLVLSYDSEIRPDNKGTWACKLRTRAISMDNERYFLCYDNGHKIGVFDVFKIHIWAAL